MDPINQTSEKYPDQNNTFWIFNLCGCYRSSAATLILEEDGKWLMTTFDMSGLPFYNDHGQWRCSGEDILFADRHGKILFSAHFADKFITLRNGQVLKKV